MIPRDEVIVGELKNIREYIRLY